MPTVKSREFFYAEHGKPLQDAALHDGIIADGDQEKANAVGDAVARRLGLTDEEIAALKK